jgi:hypothetical protein
MGFKMFDKLKAPFPPDRVSWRVGSTTQDKKKGLAFGYIDARDVMQRLDEVCGPENWQNTYTIAGTAIVCNIGVRMPNGEWVWKADGAGATDVEAEKGMMSDAFKRAAVRFGIGRYLYDIPATWVAIEPMGKSYKIADGEHAKLEAILRRGAAAIASVPASHPKAAPAVGDESRKLFIEECEKKIATFTDSGDLANWWRSDEQSQARRDFELSKSEVDGLKALVIARAELTRKAA